MEKRKPVVLRADTLVPDSFAEPRSRHPPGKQ